MFLLSIIAFIASVGVSLVPLSEFGCYHFNEAILTCIICWECKNIPCSLCYIFISDLVFTIIFFVLCTIHIHQWFSVLLFSGIAPLIMYIAMYIKARKIAKRNVNSVGAIEGEINKQLRNIKSQLRQTCFSYHFNSLYYFNWFNNSKFYCNCHI